ncbi:MOSC domain-containing protein [Roseobacter weihaiensis]|uniref:MOSC domain-containing protein n=1 Tax=Roseobacter weihaiensis TaxID=2763262 RepID=UPI001D09E3D9|nr:MOSC domain-containing protein [Roseobacter sp. H9]
MIGRIMSLARFPVKGMTAERLNAVELVQGQGIAGDRRWGFARPGSGFDPADPKPLPKDRFVVLLREAGLARLQTQLEGEVLSIRDGDVEECFSLVDAPDRAAAADFVRERLDLAETPTLVRSDPHRFTDVSVVSPDLMNSVSILSRDSVAAFAADIGEPVDTRRFRMNIEVEGWKPWAELAAVGRDLTLGTARLRVLLRTRRCAATEVNPDTAKRDLNVPRLLRQNEGHLDMGIYAEVVEGGTIKLGDVGRLL